MRRRFGSYGMFGDLKAVRAVIVPNCVGVHPLTAPDGIAWLRGDGGRRKCKSCLRIPHHRPHFKYRHNAGLECTTTSGDHLVEDEESPLLQMRKVARELF